MELWDLYDEKRKPLGRTHERGKPLQEGEYFLSVDVWVITSDGEILVVKKESKDGYVEKWGNVCGLVNKTETSKECAVRELRSIGIQTTASEITYLGLVVSSECLVETYLLVKDVLVDDLTFGEENTSEAKFVNNNIIELMHQSDLLVKDIWGRYEKYNNAILSHTHLIIEKAKLSFAEEMVNTKVNAFRIEMEMYGKDPFASMPVEDKKQSTEIKDVKNYAYIMREREDDKIVGGVYGNILNNQDINIKSIFIMEKYQNKELGTLLINFLEKEFQGIRCWKTLIPYKSWRQQHFFEKFGYTKVGESRPEADGFCFLYYEKEIVSNVETEVIPKEVFKVETQSIPEEVLEVKTQSIPEEVPEIEIQSIPEEILEVKTQSIPEEVPVEKAKDIPEVSDEVKNDSIKSDVGDAIGEETTVQTPLEGFSTVVRKEAAIRRKVHYFEMRKNVWREVLEKE